MLDKKADTPNAANNLLRVLRKLMGFALDRNFVKSNAAAAVKKLSAKSDGFHSWTEEEIAQYEAHHKIGTRARMAFALVLFTAQRRSDVVKMGRQHVRDGMISVIQQKTNVRLEIPLHEELKKVIDGTPSEHLNYITTSAGAPFTAAGFGNWFREMCREAGLPERCAAHGLRKAQSRRLADVGCSEKEIASITGHTSLAEVQRYTKAASQKRLAKQAMNKVKRHKQ